MADEAEVAVGLEGGVQVVMAAVEVPVAEVGNERSEEQSPTVCCSSLPSEPRFMATN